MYLIIIVLIILLVAVWLVSKFLYKQIALRTQNKWLRMIPLLPSAALVYILYTAVYPGEDFYKEDFKEITGLEFPHNGKILYKTASFPDQFGDYASTAVVRVSLSFYSELEDHLQQTITHNQKNEWFKSQFNSIAQKTVQQPIVRYFYWQPEDGKYFGVGFLTDNQSVIVHRTSW